MTDHLTRGTFLLQPSETPLGKELGAGEKITSVLKNV